MREKQRRYKFGDYILRERKGRYYVYKLENGGGDARETYVGPLTDVLKSYEELKRSGDSRGYPYSGPVGS
ncbi:putative integrase [Sulfuracidifex tepidarius]|uniref:putative integrase n=1 Tax=Sulfuracidifex tepidarius TaxID=1294262 RepID=UPI0034E2B7C7